MECTRLLPVYLRFLVGRLPAASSLVSMSESLLDMLFSVLKMVVGSGLGVTGVPGVGSSPDEEEVFNSTS